MRRREFITLLGGAAAASPLAARAQQGDRVRRIGLLMNSPADDSEGKARFAAFVQGLQQLGWTDGRNVRIDIRWGGAADAERHRKFAAELVALAPDVILGTTTPSVTALQRVTRTVPIVFAMAVDPVGNGFVESLARPGGNTTGFMQFEYSLAGKWLELLKQIAPGVTRAAVFRDPANPSGIGQFAVIQAMAPPLGIEVIPVNVRDAAEIERVITVFARREWRSGHDRRAGHGASRVDFQSCGPAPIAWSLPLQLLRRRRRAGLLRAPSARPVPASRRLRRPHPQGREAGRPAGAGANQI
jgi:putative ABC transport system substrate-binding protein